MFARKGVKAIVKNVAIGGTRACQWSETPTSLADKAREIFPDGLDFVWYTLGGNDLLDDDYLYCHTNAKNFKASLDCLHAATAKITLCSSTLLWHLWHEFSNTNVVQCGYDLPCSENECNPIVRFPYCGMNA